jgi:hypothetical protein
MRTTELPVGGLALVTILFAGWGCAESGLEESCRADDDCPVGRYCDPLEARCRFDCVDDRQCPAGLLCSALRGRCESGCRPTQGGVEICDGLDNDCDGETDEELSPRECARENTLGRCPGWERCEQGTWSCDARTPLAEQCNDVDDDCDGLTDEEPPELPCPLGLGVCLGATRACLDGAYAPCDYGPLHEAEETACDGLDNDCDGETDEDLPELPCPLNLGVCEGAAQRCLGGAYTPCLYGPYHEEVEHTCDGRDNDCDGRTDEDLPALDLCELGPLARDGIDNNCDGLVDEPGGCLVPIPGLAVWIDRYEATVYERSDCSGARHGESSADYPAGFPDQLFLYACAVPGQRPSGYITWEQARWACRYQGKRLCTRAEWMAACGGPDALRFPYGEAFEAGTCVDSSVSSVALPAGSRPDCLSPAGALDLSGNLTEWVEDTCAWDASMKHVQGGSTACSVGAETCDPSNPAHQTELDSRYRCGAAPLQGWCNEPASPWYAHGVRCCWDGPP